MVCNKLFLNSAVKSLVYGIHFRATTISITVFDIVLLSIGIKVALKLATVISEDLADGAGEYRMHQFGKGGSIFTRCALASNGNGETAVVVNGCKQLIAGAVNEIMDGIHGDAVSGKLGSVTFVNTVAWFRSPNFASSTRD